MELVRKLSAKAMGINAKAIVKGQENGYKKPLFRIAGTAGSIKRGESNFGPWTAFEGSFVAVDLTGETPKAFQSGLAFLPDVVTSLLAKAVETTNDDGEVTTRDVQFDITVGVMADDAKATGYVFTVTPNMKIASNAEALLERMGFEPSKLLPIDTASEPEKTKADSEPEKAKANSEPGKASKKGGK